MFIGTSHTKGSGYFINHQNARADESDVQTCNHCQKVILVQKEKDSVAVCMGCMKLTCGPCSTRALTHGCEPFMKKLEQYAEDQYRLSRILG